MPYNEAHDEFVDTETHKKKTRFVVIIGAAGVGKSSIIKKHLKDLELGDDGNKSVFQSIDKVIELVSFSLTREARSGKNYQRMRDDPLTKNVEGVIELYAETNGLNFAIESTGQYINEGWVSWMAKLKKKFDQVDLVVIVGDKSTIWERVLLRAQETGQEHAPEEEWKKTWDIIYKYRIPFLIKNYPFTSVTVYDNSGEKAVELNEHKYLTMWETNKQRQRGDDTQPKVRSSWV